MSAIEQATLIYTGLKEEVDDYFAFISSIINDKPQLHFPKGSIREIDHNIVHTLKATAFLLLYNIIEATIDKAFAAIHHEMKGTCFNSLQTNLQVHILKSFKTSVKVRDLDDVKSVSPIETALHEVTLQAIQLVSGNVDARKMRKLLETYGIQLQLDDAARGGSCLVEIKERRNKLGHGNESFIEIGKNTALEALIEQKVQTFAYLESLLNSIQDYLENTKYINSTPSNVEEMIAL